jgi:murein DD-endopeptidase MepM/ murein hydrolase activator NlpD
VIGVLVLVLAIAAGGAWWYAGREGAPAIQVQQPGKVVGQAGTLDLTVTTPRGELSQLDVTLEQNGQTYPLFSLAEPDRGVLKQDGPDRLRLTRPIGRAELPQLKSGQATIAVTAARSALYNLRHLTSTDRRTFRVRLERPRVSIASMHHFVNHGGAEMVVYRVTPNDVRSGVRVGDVTYRGYRLAEAAGVQADPSLHLAFFALLYDQDLNTPMQVFAVDEAGNQSTATIDVKVFPKTFRRSRIEVNDPFLQRVVPAILENTPDFKVDHPDDLVASYVQINRDLRQKNADRIAALADKSAPQILWNGAFEQLGNSQVESLFADHRTYFYKGDEIDQQVHLGFDLAVTANVPVHAANRGHVLYADQLGIYGNCVILDHGVGVQSLYAHLSSMDVKPGDTVEKGQTLGRSGMTGLAGGDHLHFTMLVDGRPVNSVEWWDAHWLEDRVLRKIREAAPAASPVTAAAVGQ